MKRILILCTGNSCRSQMAEGLFRHFAEDNAEIYSAGVEAHGVNPRAVNVMAELDIDISHHTSNVITEYQGQPFDFVITVCDSAKERCPWFPSDAKIIHHSFSDPADATGSEEEILNVFRSTRDDIRTFAQRFVEENVLQGSV